MRWRDIAIGLGRLMKDLGRDSEPRDGSAAFQGYVSEQLRDVRRARTRSLGRRRRFLSAAAGIPASRLRLAER
jgi:hypothetical protein